MRQVPINHKTNVSTLNIKIKIWFYCETPARDSQPDSEQINKYYISSIKWLFLIQHPDVHELRTQPNPIVIFKCVNAFLKKKQKKKCNLNGCAFHSTLM